MRCVRLAPMRARPTYRACASVPTFSYILPSHVRRLTTSRIGCMPHRCTHLALLASPGGHGVALTASRECLFQPRAQPDPQPDPKRTAPQLSAAQLSVQRGSAAECTAQRAAGRPTARRTVGCTARLTVTQRRLECRSACPVASRAQVRTCPNREANPNSNPPPLHPLPNPTSVPELKLLKPRGQRSLVGCFWLYYRPQSPHDRSDRLRSDQLRTKAPAGIPSREPSERPSERRPPGTV